MSTDPLPSSSPPSSDNTAPPHSVPSPTSTIDLLPSSSSLAYSKLVVRRERQKKSRNWVLVMAVAVVVAAVGIRRTGFFAGTVSESFSASFPPLPSKSAPATNHLEIVHQRTAILGDYVIDTSITRPDYLFLFDDIESPSGVVKPNVVFKTAFEHIEVNLWVKGGGKVDIRAEKTDGTGHCWIAIVDREVGTTLNLFASAMQDLRVSLPSSFNGRVIGGSERGLVTFSAALKPRTTTFDKNPQVPLGGKYWIGEFDTALSDRTAAGKMFKGDSLTVKSEGGDILIETWEERKEADEVQLRVVAKKAWLTNVLGALVVVLNAVTFSAVFG